MLAAQKQTQKFPSRVRLSEAAQFSSALKLRPIVRNARFALHMDQRGLAVESVTGSSALPPQLWRLGLVIPKRFEASSVRRNAIKRVWREVFRLQQPVLREQAGGDLVVRFMAPFTATESSLKQLKRQCHEDAQGLIRLLLDRLQRPRKD